LTANQYPYTAMQHPWARLMPRWVQDAPRKEIILHFADRAFRDKVKADPEFRQSVDEHGSWEGIVASVVRNPALKAFEGKRAIQIAEMRGQGEDPAEAVFDVILEEGNFPHGVFHNMAEDDVRTFMRQPWVSIGSDGTALNLNAQGLPHPRSFGTNVRVLGKYARDEQLFPLEEAIRKMTALPASVLRLTDRGLLREGHWADVVVFDPSTVADRAAFEARLREKGRAYHIHHPFNVMLNSGRATPAQIRGWVANRYYYQIAIPIKDAALLSNCPDREVRRGWVQRILDHDGFELGGVHDSGGIDAWLRLAVAVGLSREEVQDLRHVVPAVRFAVDAYVNFVRRTPWQEAVCSSLTELFAPEIHRQRLANWPEHYPWIDPEGLSYFRNRVSQARRDVDQGLAITLDHFTTRALQDRALEILQFKLDILWAMNDAIGQKYGVVP
jgi:pyrroloquinoline-quinone synthase